jgi:hypothetical protein
VNAVRNIAAFAFGSITWYLKFSHVRGHTSALRVISILPAGRPPMAMSKNTTGLDMINWLTEVQKVSSPEKLVQSMGQRFPGSGALSSLNLPREGCLGGQHIIQACSSLRLFVRMVRRSKDTLIWLSLLIVNFDCFPAGTFTSDKSERCSSSAGDP